MLISLLSVIANTLNKSLLSYITANLPNTHTHHGYKTQHSTVTALHTLNKIVAKGFNKMASPARTTTVALDMSKAFDTITIHILIRKLPQTNIPSTIMKFLQNTQRDVKHIQHTETTHPYNVNLKLAFLNVASSHPHYLTFTLHTYHHQEHRFKSWHTQMTSPSQLRTKHNDVQTTGLLCSFQTLRNIRAIWTSK